MDKCNLLDFYNIKSIPNDELWEFVTIPGPLIYRIYNTITFKSYIGFTKIHLHSRFFTGWRGGQGYESSSKGRIHITDGTHNKMIYPEDLQKYEYDGWRLGRTMNKSSKGKIIINNGLFNKMISSENFPEYEETGWKLGMIRK